MRIDVESYITEETKKFTFIVSDDFSLVKGDTLILDTLKHQVTIEKIYVDISSNTIADDSFLNSAKILKVNGEDYNIYLFNLNHYYHNRLIRRKKCVKKLKIKITSKDLKGDIKNFPIQVVKKMCKNQIKQGNAFNVKIFQDNKSSGFKWDETKEGRVFWLSVIKYNDFDLFFKKYPKSKESKSIGKK